jgi:hypothetical protein
MNRTSIIARTILSALTLVALMPCLQAQEPANKPGVAINRGSPITFVTSSAPVRVLTEVVKASKPTDLLLSVTAETSIITDVATTGSEMQRAEGKLVFYITLNNDPTPILPTGPAGPNQTRQGDTGEIVFANQIYSRTTNLGLDDNNDMVQTYLETKHATGFNWAVLNAQSGTHTIHVWAKYDESETSTATATGVVGNRSLIVQPVKCQVNESVVDGTTSPLMPITLN